MDSADAKTNDMKITITLKNPITDKAVQNEQHRLRGFTICWFISSGLVKGVFSAASSSMFSNGGESGKQPSKSGDEIDFLSVDDGCVRMVW